MKIKKFKLCTYLFSTIAFFLCMNTAQAYIYADCTVVDGKTRHQIQAYIYNNKGYSSFGKANNAKYSNSTGLEMTGDEPANNLWEITKNKSSKLSNKETYTINALLNDNKSIVSNNATCKIHTFDDRSSIGDDEDQNPSKIANFFNANPNFEVIHSYDNPIRVRTTICKPNDDDEYTPILGDGSKKKRKCDDCCSVS